MPKTTGAFTLDCDGVHRILYLALAKKARVPKAASRGRMIVGIKVTPPRKTRSAGRRAGR